MNYATVIWTRGVGKPFQFYPEKKNDIQRN